MSNIVRDDCIILCLNISLRHWPHLVWPYKCFPSWKSICCYYMIEFPAKRKYLETLIYTREEILWSIGYIISNIYLPRLWYFVFDASYLDKIKLLMIFVRFHCIDVSCRISTITTTCSHQCAVRWKKFWINSHPNIFLKLLHWCPYIFSFQILNNINIGIYSFTQKVCINVGIKKEQSIRSEL